MNLHAVSITVTTDVQLSDEQTRDAAARWAAAAGFELGMTSTHREEPWARFSAMVKLGPGSDPAATAQTAVSTLAAVLRELGVSVTQWLALEVLSSTEIEQRGRRPSIPPMVSAAELAELAGLSSVQRIYQLESERKAGKRDDFPAPVLDGYWLRSMAEHWASTRKRKPGPAPKAGAGE